MLKFLKKFEFDCFRLRGEYGLGLGISRWAVSVELIFWHFSVEFFTDAKRANRERAHKYLADLYAELEEEDDL
jgi:hypothetical protein